MHYYRAPWDGLLIAMTVFSSLLLVVLSFVPAHLARVPPPMKGAVPALAFAIVLATWAFAPRAYEIDGHRLIVHRNIGSREYDLRGLLEVRADEGVMPLFGAMRVAGVGGMFGYYGKYYSRTLGTFTAFVTDRRRAVALKLRQGTVVVSPDDPKLFADEVRASAQMG
jgi:hypothetical protein